LLSEVISPMLDGRHKFTSAGTRGCDTS